MKHLALALMFSAILLPGLASAQHLKWKASKSPKPFTCLYGEIEVLQSGKTIYYCGCNWWPGNPAGGYTGIQDRGDGSHNMIFSIWDTSPTLNPRTTEADPKAVFNRFGGEGTGAHTHLDYQWKLGETYRYYATKEQDSKGENTLTKLYFLDAGLRKWVHEATITSPNDGHESVKTFGGMLNAFLENWSGTERERPKLALYRLWVGTNPSDLAPVTEAAGDGKWGVINDTFYMAEGETSAVEALLARFKKPGTWVERGLSKDRRLQITPRRISKRIIANLSSLPKAPSIQEH